MPEGDLDRLLTALGDSGARYLIVGGVAVVLHGHPRFTADLDLVVELEATNVRKLLTALARLGYQSRAPVDAMQFADAAVRRSWIEDKGMTVFSLWSPDIPATAVDLFVEEPFDFNAAYSRAVEVDLAYARVRVASIADLITLKRAAGRAKDLQDVEELEAIARALESTG